MKNLLTIAILLGLTSCATSPTTKEEKSIRILRNSDAPQDCRELGRVHAPGLMSFTEQGRDDDLRKVTYKIGGDTVMITRRDSNNTVFGIAYKCNK